MKGAIAWTVTVMMVTAAAAYGFYHYRVAESQRTYQAELEALKRGFLKGVPALPLVADDAYNDAVAADLAQYFRGLEALAQRSPQHFDVERKRLEVAEKVKAGAIDRPQEAQRKERIDFTLGIFNQMRRGAYRPAYSSADNGFRFDIIDVKPTPKGDRLRLTFVHWGAYGEVRYRSISGRFTSDATDGIPRLEGASQPPRLLIEPERWVAEFVPGAQVGYYELPLMPASASALQLTFAFDIITASGTRLPVVTEFPSMEIPAAWKTSEPWASGERKLSAEELAAEQR
ncbi:MAG: hypothetical protein AAFU77_12360 [Myxococcota bacterium]